MKRGEGGPPAANDPKSPGAPGGAERARKPRAPVGADALDAALADEIADDAQDPSDFGDFADPAEPESFENDGDGATLVRLNKYLADHGVASRRRCDELIERGQVTVDGETETRLGTKIDPERQTVEIDGFVLRPQGVRKRYYLLNKPSGVVCTNEQRELRPRAVDLITDPRKGRIYTVGRLDEESKGLIVLTNDGEFAQRVMHPRYGIEKTYMVRVNGRIDDETLQKVRNGIHLAEGRTSGARIVVFKRQRESSWLSVTIFEGMNREIRRVFARVGFKVVELKRTRIGPITDRGLKVSRWRDLTPAEVQALVSGAPSEVAQELRRKSRLKRPPRTFSGKRGMAAGPRPVTMNKHVPPIRQSSARGDAPRPRRGWPDGAPKSPGAGRGRREPLRERGSHGQAPARGAGPKEHRAGRPAFGGARKPGRPGAARPPHGGPRDGRPQRPAGGPRPPRRGGGR